jgi:hypothetical protein
MIIDHESLGAHVTKELIRGGQGNAPLPPRVGNKRIEKGT